MDGVEIVTARLAMDGVQGEIWVDGSFVTKKIDPEDADIVVVVTGAFLSSATQAQRDALDWVGSNLKGSHHCDSYLHIEYDAPHPLSSHSQWMRAYWIRQFGFSRGNHLKGMVLVKVP